MPFYIGKADHKILLRYKQANLQFFATFTLFFAAAVLLVAVKDPSRLVGLPVCLLFVIVAVCAHQSGKYEFDLNKRELRYFKTRFFFKKTTGIISFECTETVLLQKQCDADEETFRIVIQSGDTTLILNDIYEPEDAIFEIYKTVYETVFNRALEKAQESLAGKSLTRFSQSLIPLKLAKEKEDEIRQLISAKRSVEAISRVRQYTQVDLKTAKKYVDDLNISL